MSASDSHVNLLLEHLALHVIIRIRDLPNTIEPAVWILRCEVLRSIRLALRAVVARRIVLQLPREPVAAPHNAYVTQRETATATATAREWDVYRLE